MVQCGEDFTIAATSENALYYWGARRSNPNSKHSSTVTPKMGVAEIKTTRLETIPSVSHGLDMDEDTSESGTKAGGHDHIQEPEILRKTSGTKPVAFVHPFGLSDSAVLSGKEGERYRHGSTTGRRKSLISNTSGPKLTSVSEQLPEPGPSTQIQVDNGSAETETSALSNR